MMTLTAATARTASLYARLRNRVKEGISIGGNALLVNRYKVDKPAAVGRVFIVGAGPGDAELLTLKAYRAIQSAQVILFDALVSADVVAMFPASAERIYVGKRYAQHSMSQTEITTKMLNLALEGKTVVRVKGGDPAIFARVGEECALLDQYEVPCFVIPGITAASGASAYAGIPLTHRGCAQSVRFVTAHMKTESDEPDWASMVPKSCSKHGETLVFYMGLRRLDLISQRLLEQGMPEEFPVAVIEQATHAEQKVCIGDLGSIAERVRASGITGPAITIVGEVVHHRYKVSSNCSAVQSVVF
jgi:uroporphyrin-III C-methyltransferase